MLMPHGLAVWCGRRAGINSLRLTGLGFALGYILFWGSECRSEEARRLISVEYEDVSQTCLSKPASEHLLDAIHKSNIPASAPLTIVAFSDQVEMRQTGWRQQSPCVKGQIPEFLIGHERMAWLRAAAIIESARAAGIAAFGRAPRLLTGADSSYQSHDPYDLVVVLQRSPGSGREHRHVDVRWTEPEPALVLLNQPQANSHEHAIAANFKRRIGGWALTSLGISVVGMGVGFLGAGGYKHARAVDSYDPSWRQTMAADAQQLFIGGGVAVGLGTGLVAIGALLVQSSKERLHPTDGESTSNKIVP